MGTATGNYLQTFDIGSMRNYTGWQSSRRIGYQVVGLKVDGKSLGAITSYPLSNITANHKMTTISQSSKILSWPRPGPPEDLHLPAAHP